MEHNPARLYKGPVGVVLEPVVRRLRGHGLARRHLWVWKAHRAVWRLTRSDRVLIAGHDMLLDRNDSLGLASGDYEPEEHAWYLSVLRPGDLVVEVGANIGYFSLILARAVGPEGRVLSYEPDPELNSILRRNLAHNGYLNVEARQAAVADKAGELTFYRSAKSMGDNRLFTHGVDGATFKVRTVALDDDLADLDRRIDLVKMDIQGAEPLALAGFERILGQRPPRRMLIEFWPHGITGMGHDPRAVVELLRKHGYLVEELGGGELDLDDALTRMTPENLEWVNLVCTHATAEEPS